MADNESSGHRAEGREERDGSIADFRSFAEIGDVVVVSVDENAKVQNFTANAGSFFVPGTIVQNRDIRHVRPLVDYPYFHPDVQAALTNGRSTERIIGRERHEGKFLVTIQPFTTAAFPISGASIVVLDVSERRRPAFVERDVSPVPGLATGDTVRSAARTMQHRLRNMIATIRSITRSTLASSLSLDDFAAHFYGRIDALGRVQNMGSRSSEGEVDLRELITEELLSQTVSGASNRISVSGPEVFLRQAKSEILALAIHELTTNALKFGSLSTDHGTLLVGWELSWQGGAQIFKLKWEETGCELSSFAKRGFGFDILEHGLQYELGAKTDIRSSGGRFVCEINVPATDELFVL